MRSDHRTQPALLTRVLAARLHPGAARRALALSGKRPQALKVLKGLEALRPERYVSPFEFAVIYLARGDRAAALQWLTKAADDRAFEMTSLTVDPRLQSVRRTPEFVALVKRLGLRG